jgi:hypothetical protein
MGILQRFERRLGGLVEGAFARVFKGGVEPVEIAAALRREADDHRAISPTRTLVPNVYRIELSRSDYDRLTPYLQPLSDELADIVSEHAAESRYTFVGAVDVQFTLDDTVDVGVFHVRSEVSADGPAPVPARQPAAAPARPPAAAPLRRPAVPATPPATATQPTAANAWLVHNLDGRDRQVPLNQPEVIIGRGTDATLRLDDNGVSRRHGKLTRLDGSWRYEDLGSTNGTMVNGQRIGAVDLSDGDRLELGSSLIVFRSDDRLARRPAQA